MLSYPVLLYMHKKSTLMQLKHSINRPNSYKEKKKE